MRRAMDAPSRPMIPETIKFRKMKAATIKMEKINLALSLIPKMLSPATAQMITKTKVIIADCDKGKKEEALRTALTADIQAVRV